MRIKYKDIQTRLGLYDLEPILKNIPDLKQYIGLSTYKDYVEIHYIV